MKRLCSITILILFFTFSTFVYAQEPVFLSQNLEEQLIITTSPEFPEPFSEVTIRVENYLLDLDRSLITWKVNDAVVAEEIGKQTLTIPTRGAGVVLNITVEILDTENEKAIGSVRINPGSVDLIWEADVYTPPFYKGKALNTSESRVTLVALPHFKTLEGRLLSTREVLFEWITDKGVDVAASGLGKNTFTLSSDKVYKPRFITVRATSFDKSMVAERTIDLSIHKPEVILYEESPLSGIMFERALVSPVSFEDEEITLFAAPYFFSTGIPTSPAMGYRWEINGQSFEERSNRLTLRRDGDGGSALVKLFIERADKYFQREEKSLNLSF